MWNVDWRKDSSTTQIWMAEGAHKIILGMGAERFGPPEAAIEAAIRGILDVDQLKRLAVRLLKVSSWEELVAEEKNRTRSRPRKS